MSTQQHSCAPTTTEPGQALEELRTTISATLRDLTAEYDLVRLLIRTHQQRLGFLTAEGRAAIAQQVVADQMAAAVRRRKQEPVGHAWMRPDATRGPGVTQAPGDVASISAQVVTVRTLHDLVRDLTTALYSRGVCTLHQLAPEPPVEDITDHLRSLSMDLDDPAGLADTCRTLTTLVDALRDVIDGNDRTHLPAPCPHCDRDSLIVFWREKLIRCDKSPKSRHYAPCTCSDPLCECKQRPVTYRHTWYLDRPPSAANSWQSLATRLNLTRNSTTTKEPTR